MCTYSGCTITAKTKINVLKKNSKDIEVIRVSIALFSDFRALCVMQYKIELH